jgi:hypothetical protein
VRTTHSHFSDNSETIGFVDSQIVSHRSGSAEPHCADCGLSIAEGARFRRIAVPGEGGNVEPIPMHVVYCQQCGGVFSVLKVEFVDQDYV